MWPAVMFLLLPRIYDGLRFAKFGGQRLKRAFTSKPSI